MKKTYFSCGLTVAALAATLLSGCSSGTVNLKTDISTVSQPASSSTASPSSTAPAGSSPASAKRAAASSKSASSSAKASTAPVALSKNRVDMTKGLSLYHTAYQNFQDLKQREYTTELSYTTSAGAIVFRDNSHVKEDLTGKMPLSLVETDGYDKFVSDNESPRFPYRYIQYVQNNMDYLQDTNGKVTSEYNGYYEQKPFYFFDGSSGDNSNSGVYSESLQYVSGEEAADSYVLHFSLDMNYIKAHPKKQYAPNDLFWQMSSLSLDVTVEKSTGQLRQFHLYGSNDKGEKTQFTLNTTNPGQPVTITKPDFASSSTPTR